MNKLTHKDFLKWLTKKNKTSSASYGHEDYLVEKFNELFEEVEKLKSSCGPCGKCKGA